MKSTRGPIHELETELRESAREGVSVTFSPAPFPLEDHVQVRAQAFTGPVQVVTTVSPDEDLAEATVQVGAQAFTGVMTTVSPDEDLAEATALLVDELKGGLR